MARRALLAVVCRTGVVFFPTAQTRQRERVLGTRGVLEKDPGAAGHFHYRKVLGLVELASSEQTVLEVNVRVELVGRAQMTNTNEIQEAPGSVFSAPPLIGGF